MGVRVKLNLLSMSEAAAQLGVSRQMVLKYVAAGRIPTVALAGRRYIQARHARKPQARKPGPKPRGSGRAAK